LKTKLKTLLIASGVLAAAAGGGAAIAGATGDGDREDRGGDREDRGGDRAITGSALDRAGEAALKATGGGKVTETEAGDEESYYEVEVTKADGSQVDVQLDKSFAVLDATADEADSAGEQSDGDGETDDQ
jgi:uncharacterized membrane protein YkoI